MLRSTALLIILIGSVAGMDYHVVPSGNDTATGTAEAPLATLRRATELAGPGDTVLVHAGLYREPLIPQRSGEKGRPITFKAFGDGRVVISGAKLVEGLSAESEVWVRKPWKKPLWTIDNYPDLSDRTYPFRASARNENIFVDGVRLHWAPTRKDLRPGFYTWSEAELAIMPLDPSKRPDACVVESAEIATLLGAWQGDPSSTTVLREVLAKNPAHEWNRPDVRDLSDITVSGFVFQRGTQILNRAGVRSNGPRWIIEDCIIEQMNAIGLAADVDSLVRRCVLRWNGQAGLGNSGRGARFEDILAYGNNEKNFSISWGGGGNKLCRTEDIVIERMVSCFNNGSGLWFDIDCAGVKVSDSLFFGNSNINAGFFWEISFDTLFERNVLFANRQANGDFYGAGVVLSCSSDAVVRDSLLLGGGGGIAMGGARGAGADRTRPGPEGGRWVTKRNLVEGNLVVEPQYFALSFRGNDGQESSSQEAGNRVIGNTFVVKNGSQQVRYGRRWLDGIAAFETAHAGLAKDNHVLEGFGAMPAADQKRTSAAIRRMLEAIVRVVPGFPSGAADASLVGLPAVGGDAEGSGQAWMLRSSTGCTALIDIAGGKSTKFEFRADGAPDGSAVLWQFGSDGIGRRTESPLRDGIVSGRASGALAIITGLPRGAYAPSQVISVKAPAEVADGAPVPVRCVIGNPSDVPLTITASGPGLAATALELKPGESKTLTVEANLQRGAKTLRYQAVIGRGQPIIVEVPIRMVAALAVAAAGSMGLPALSESGAPFGVVLGAGQVLPGIYDEDTGARWDSPENSSAQARLWWSAAGLMLHIVVKDDRIVPNPDPAKAYAGDGVELFFDTREASLGAPQYGGGVLHLWLQPPTSSTWEAVTLMRAPANDGISEGRRRDGGYEFRLLLPWKPLTVADPQPGRRLGFDMIVNDADRLKADAAVRRSSMVWRGGPDNYRDPSRFGRIVLNAK